MLDHTFKIVAARCGFVPLQKSHRNHRGLVCEVKPYPIWFLCRRKSYNLSEQFTIWECALVVYHVFSYIYVSTVEH